jgi:hypothetical protein
MKDIANCKMQMLNWTRSVFTQMYDTTDGTLVLQ